MKLNWAERWVVNNPVRAFYQRRIIRWMKKAGNLPEDALVLEVGAGRCMGALMLLREFGERRILATDLDRRMIRTGARLLNPDERRHIHLGVTDILNLPFTTGGLDAVFNFGALHHLVDWQSGMREISRVIKPGGRFYLEEFYPGSYANILTKHILKHPKENRFRSPDFNDALTQNGFQILQTRDIPLYGIFAVCRKID